VSTTQQLLRSGFRVKHRDEHLAAVHGKAKVERAWIGANPMWIFDKSKTLPLARIVAGCVKHSHVVLLDIVHHREELAVGRETRFMTDALDVIEFHFPYIRV